MEHFCFLVILSLSALAMALQPTTPCNAAQARPQPIYDTDGHELTGNNLYNIMPVGRNLSDQCVSPSSFREDQCRVRAILTPCKQFRGTDGYVRIRLAEVSDSSDTEALPRLSTDVVIDFRGVVTSCVYPLQWYVRPENTKQMHVTAGLLTGMEGCKTPAGTCLAEIFMFRVEKHGAGYKLMSCPDAPCRDLVLLDYAGRRYLTVEKDGREPLVVVFKKFHRVTLPPASHPQLG
ncbi:hypothetical protein ZWY2020_026442 [Hordeum vulgare]|nr:hypothetical protein ZWY2020_026442 [Hordeum vulgare]